MKPTHKGLERVGENRARAQQNGESNQSNAQERDGPLLHLLAALQISLHELHTESLQKSYHSRVSYFSFACDKDHLTICLCYCCFPFSCIYIK